MRILPCSLKAASRRSRDVREEILVSPQSAWPSRARVIWPLLGALWVLSAAGVGATEPPQIRQVQPPGGSVISDLRPLIAARFLPGEDGPPIDVSSVVVLLDGVRISGIVTQSGFRFAPAANL